jgi:1-aminocyclopropane-1-carboxylate deaminase
MQGMIDLVQKDHLLTGSKVLYAHLGGGPALNGYSYTFRNGENWRSPAGKRVHSFAILTTTPNELCAELHNRMPVVPRARGVAGLARGGTGGPART